jgi:hypothetical protein
MAGYQRKDSCYLLYCVAPEIQEEPIGLFFHGMRSHVVYHQSLETLRQRSRALRHTLVNFLLLFFFVAHDEKGLEISKQTCTISQRGDNKQNRHGCNHKARRGGSTFICEARISVSIQS